MYNSLTSDFALKRCSCNFIFSDDDNDSPQCFQYTKLTSIRVPIVMIFDEALAADRNATTAENSTTDHEIASDFRVSTGRRQAIGHLTMSRDFSRDDRCSTRQCNV